jgi:hypothetical protein
MRRVLLAAALFLTACGQVPIAQLASPTATASPVATASPSPTPEVAHFVAPEPSAAKMAAINAGGDAAFWDFVAFHEVGLRAGQSVSYHLIGTGTANYQCMRTNGTLDAAPGTNQVATAQVSARQTLTADASGGVSAVITLRPPAPANPRCPSGYAIQVWRVSYTNTTVMDEANNLNWSAPDSGGQAQ